MDKENSPTGLDAIVNLQRYPIDHSEFQTQCKRTLEQAGVLVLPDFLTQIAIAKVTQEGEASSCKAYYTGNDHNVYLKPTDPTFSLDHPRNRQVSSSKGCITSDQIANDSMLRTLYDNAVFKTFLCEVLEEQELFEYADPLSSINLHYAAHGQELGWHFDNSSFALVLFRGRNSIHRVTPTQGEVTRMLAVLAYNSEPGIALSESARLTFYGRTG